MAQTHMSFWIGKMIIITKKDVWVFSIWAVLLLQGWFCEPDFFSLVFKIKSIFLYNVYVQPWYMNRRKEEEKMWMCFAQMTLGLCWLCFFMEKRRGHLRPAVCSWEGETNCLNVSSCETIRLQGCCQGCFWHLAKSLRAILSPLVV